MKPVVYEPYEESSWDAWESAIIRRIHGMAGKEDVNAWLPSPADIEERCRMVRWLDQQGFPNRWIGCIMQNDNPDYQTVVELVERIGAEAAIKQLRPLVMSQPRFH